MHTDTREVEEWVLFLTHDFLAFAQGWFDTLRMEAYDDNIRVTMLCPGPVFSNALKFAFTGNTGEVRYLLPLSRPDIIMPCFR